MRSKIILLFLAGVICFATPSHAAIDRLQGKDFPNLAIGLLNLYYNIGKGALIGTRDVVVNIPSLPKAIMTDVLGIRTEGAPSAYYMTEKEKRERRRQKRLEERLERERELEQAKTSGAPRKSEGLSTKIKP
jgi:hypothetical protein